MLGLAVRCPYCDDSELKIAMFVLHLSPGIPTGLDKGLAGAFPTFSITILASDAAADLLQIAF